MMSTTYIFRKAQNLQIGPFADVHDRQICLTMAVPSRGHEEIAGITQITFSNQTAIARSTNLATEIPFSLRAPLFPSCDLTDFFEVACLWDTCTFRQWPSSR